MFDLAPAYDIIGDGLIRPEGCYTECNGTHRCCKRRLIYVLPAERTAKSFNGCYRCPGYQKCNKPLICRLYPVVGTKVDHNCSVGDSLPSDFVERAHRCWEYIAGFPEGSVYLTKVERFFNL